MDGRLRSIGPGKTVFKIKQKHDEINNKLLYLFNKITSDYRYSLQRFDARLTALNPMAVLQRGYSITRTIPGGRIVMDPETVRQGQPLRITLARGELNVVAKHPALRNAGDE
jgi:exodeoxyribonuclease VII large subunit